MTVGDKEMQRTQLKRPAIPCNLYSTASLHSSKASSRATSRIGRILQFSHRLSHQGSPTMWSLWQPPTLSFPKAFKATTDVANLVKSNLASHQPLEDERGDRILKEDTNKHNPTYLCWDCMQTKPSDGQRVLHRLILGFIKAGLALIRGNKKDDLITFRGLKCPFTYNQPSSKQDTYCDSSEDSCFIFDDFFVAGISSKTSDYKELVKQDCVLFLNTQLTVEC